MTAEARGQGREVGGISHHASAPSPTLHGRWLLLAKVAWVAVAIAALAIAVFSVPSSFEHFRSVCTAASEVCSERAVDQPTSDGVRALGDAGLSVRSYALLNVVIDKVFELPLDFNLLGGDTPIVLLLLKIGFTLSFLLVPFSIGVAVVRSRLFDIDVLINRTLVYGSLTATLVALYLGGIVVLQRLFVVLTGEKSTLAVVASTLAIAALFNPLRRRIQSFIDRRFYRSKYDARKTLEAFSAKLRDETDLETLNTELVRVMRETMQPAHISLWLRPEDSAPKRGTPR
jgi:hypothetical protein